MKDLLTKAEVLEIVKHWRNGLGYVSIAALMGLRPGRVEKVLRGESYVSITGGRLSNGKRSKANR